jgi:hypothetical protein
MARGAAIVKVSGDDRRAGAPRRAACDLSPDSVPDWWRSATNLLDYFKAGAAVVVGNNVIDQRH